MIMKRVVFLGGNGHCAARLAPARAALGDSLELIEPPYPGFEGRPRADSYAAFLDAVAPSGNGATLIYATGIGGLFALSLRARKLWRDVPLVLQAPVLWGLEHRLMPKLMRLGLANFAFRHVFESRWFQRRFLRTKFEKPPAGDFGEAFFAGYRACSAAADFFRWLTPALLRQLERDFAADPAALAKISVWWGGRDPVVSLQELRWTEAALHVQWPVRVFPAWGHYPMIDAPAEWAGELQHAVAAASAIPQRGGAEAQ